MPLELVKSDVAEGATNTPRPLTHPLDDTKEGLAMDASQHSEGPYSPLEATQGDEEVWRPVVGSEGLYEVSNIGRVRSLTKTVRCSRIHNKSKKWETYERTIPGRLICQWQPGKRASQYPTAHIVGRGPVRIHVLVSEAFIGPRPVGMVTRHLNGDPYDNRLENLAYGTPAENSADMIRHGRSYWALQTHCKWGHEFTPENTKIRTDPGHKGSRECRQCHKAPGLPCKGSFKTPASVVGKKAICAWCGRAVGIHNSGKTSRHNDPNATQEENAA